MSNEIRVGVLVLIAIGVLAFFIIRIENLGVSDPETSYEVRVRFENAAGLAIDDPVLLAGVGVGR
ncbi:MAG: hypothetical protein R3344_10405, partial [Acidobacteriota bacterium]|nr:hypothetical protein [Acidobacteriota bacterium]